MVGRQWPLHGGEDEMMIMSISIWLHFKLICAYDILVGFYKLLWFEADGSNSSHCWTKYLKILPIFQGHSNVLHCQITIAYDFHELKNITI